MKPLQVILLTTRSLPPRAGRDELELDALLCPRVLQKVRPQAGRTWDLILTMEPPGTAVRTAVSPAHARP